MFDFDSALGIEIKGNQMVLVTLTKGIAGYTLKNQRVIEGVFDLESSELRGRVQSYLESNGFNRENVIFGVPRDQVVVHTVELPLDVEENLDQVVSFQVGKLEPSEDSPSYYDYVVLERNEKTKTLVLQIVMLPQREIEDQLLLLDSLNLYPAAIRLSSFGTHQVFKLHQDGYSGPCLVIDVNKGGAEFLVIPGTGQCLTQAASDPSGEVDFEWLLTELESFLAGLRLKDPTLRKVYVSGEEGPRLLPALQEHFGDAELLSKGMKLSVSGAKPAFVAQILPSLGLAVTGVNKSAFSRFNLVPAEKRRMGDRPSFIPTLVLAALLLVVLVAAGTREYFQQTRFLESVSSEVERLRPQVDRAMQIRQQLQDRRGKVEELAEMLRGRQTVLRVLRDLTERIPEDTYLQNVNVRSGQVSITGLSDAASGLINILSESEYMDNVESRYITRDPATGKNKFNFEAQIRLDQVSIAE